MNVAKFLRTPANGCFCSEELLNYVLYEEIVAAGRQLLYNEIQINILVHDLICSRISKIFSNHFTFLMHRELIETGFFLFLNMFY